MERILVVLDLDETLIFASEEPLERAPDFRCSAYAVYRRPGLKDFLMALKDEFRVAVWTSSGGVYANCVVSSIFSKDYPLEFVWARDRCTRRRNFDSGELGWLKNLQKVKKLGYNLERVLAIDDTPAKYERHYGNLIKVSEFTGDPADRELSLLSTYLKTIANKPNMRRLEKRDWRLTAQTA